MLPEELHGFRPKRGTATAVEKLLKDIYSRRDKGKGAVVVALDASAAFDLASRELILESIRAIGGKEEVISWLKSYLSERKQYVEVAEERSNAWESDVGVVQGGPMSPDLWNVLCITLPRVNLDTDSVIYADDGAEVLDLSALGNTQMVAEKVAVWYKEMGLTLNVKKSEIMPVGGPHGDVCINGSVLKPVDEVRFLGCRIQSNLSWNAHVSDMSRRIRAAASKIRLLGSEFTAKQRKTLYNAWIGGIVMCNAYAYLPRLSQKNLNDLQTAMNAGVRACSGLPRRGLQPITEARRKLGLPSVRQLREEQILIRAWSNRRLHLREAERGPRTRAAAAGKRALPHGGRDPAVLEEVKGWNRLPEDLKYADCERRVKKQIKMIVRDPDPAHQ